MESKSKKNSKPKANNTAPIVISSDEEEKDDELREAIERSKLDTTRMSRSPGPLKRAREQVSSDDSDSNDEPVARTAEQAAFISERAQMEKERLERQKRMRATGVLPPSSPPQKTASSASATNGKEKGKGSMKLDVNPPLKQNNTANGDGFFWDGEIRQTANMHVEKSKDTKPTFRFSELVGPVSFSFPPRPHL